MNVRVFDICSGIGGCSLGLHATGGFETVAFCETDEFCRDILTRRFPSIPVYGDLKELANDEETIRKCEAARGCGAGGRGHYA